MNKHTTPHPAPVSPLFAPVCLLPRFARFIVREMPEGFIVFDTIFAQQSGPAHRTAQSATATAAMWADVAKRKAVA